MAIDVKWRDRQSAPTSRGPSPNAVPRGASESPCKEDDRGPSTRCARTRSFACPNPPLHCNPQENSVMKRFRHLATATLILPASLLAAACSPESAPDPAALDPGVAVATQADDPVPGPHVNAVTEAPTGFDGLSNGNCTQANFKATGLTFSEVEAFEDGLGPTFNNTSCISCHENPRGTAEGHADDANTKLFGGSGSQITELRAGHFNGVTFVDHPGGSLINDRANDRSIQEHILSGNEVQVLRLTLSIAGDGFVEAIDSNTLLAISNAQPAAQRGTLIQVPVLEAAGQSRGGRFGWKDQHASLLSFASDAYINEMGVTNKFAQTENTS